MRLSAVIIFLYGPQSFNMIRGCSHALEAPRDNALPSAALKIRQSTAPWGGRGHLKADEKLHSASLETLCVVHGDNDTFCSRNRSISDRAAYHVSVCCVLWTCALIQGFVRLRRGFAISHTAFWKDLMQEIDGI